MGDDVARFRLWLIHKLTRSRWVRPTDEPIDETAVRIGVQPDVLRAAQAQLDAERKADGKPPLIVGTGRVRRGPRKQLDLDMPQAVYEDYERYSSLRGLPGAVVLRSVVHTLLSGPDNPRWVGRGWVYRGQHQPLDRYQERAGKGGWPWNVKADLSDGAFRALIIRAEQLGCTYTALARGAVIDLLEGRAPRLIIVTSSTAMWADESRYWTLAPKEP